MLAIPEADDRKWFVLLIEPQMERKAAAHLIGRRFKPYLPEETVVATRGVRRRKITLRKPIFRGYLFVHLSFVADAHRWGKVCSVPGARQFMRVNDDYAIVPDHEMARIYSAEQALLSPQRPQGPSSIFSNGEVVRVSEGPFSGFTAEIKRVDDEERITILLSMLGRASRVQLSAYQLEKL